MRLNPGFNRVSNEVNETTDAMSCFSKMQTLRAHSDMYRRHGGPKHKEAKQSERQSVRTTTAHQQLIEHEKITKQRDSKHFFLDWIGQCEKISWNHILGECKMTQNIQTRVLETTLDKNLITMLCCNRRRAQWSHESTWWSVWDLIRRLF